MSSVLTPLRAALLHSLPLCSLSDSFTSLTQLHFGFVLVLQYLEYKVFPALMVPSSSATGSQDVPRLCQG